MDSYPRRSYAWTVVVILIATAVLSYTDRQVLSLLVDPIRVDLGLSDTQMSLLMGSAFAVVYGIAGIPLGYLADRLSRRNLIMAGIIVWSLGTIACGLARGFSGLFSSRIVVGLGEAALSPAAIALISDYFPPSRRGTAVGCFLSGIAMGSGVAILIGGAVLQLVEFPALAGHLGGYAPWRLTLLAIGAPGLLWALVILFIREPDRQGAGDAAMAAPAPADAAALSSAAANADATANADAATVTVSAAGDQRRHIDWAGIVPIYIVLAAASFADNAVGAWAPTLLIREFGKSAAQVGIELGVLLTAGFGGGVLLGGVLADRAGTRGGWSRKFIVLGYAGALILPASLLMNSPHYAYVLLGVPLYFLLSGIVTAVGFSAILDVVPSRSRAFAMALSFFLNVALGAGLGPTAVAVAETHVFSEGAGLGPPLVLTVVLGYLCVLAAIMLARVKLRASAAASAD